MTGFDVVPVDVRRFAKLVESSYGDMGGTDSGYGDNGRPDLKNISLLGSPLPPPVPGAGLQMLIYPHAEKLRIEANDGLMKAEHSLQPSSVNLNKAASLYENTDFDHAKHLDAIDPVNDTYLNRGGRIVHMHEYKPGDVPDPGSAVEFNKVKNPEVWGNKPLDASGEIDPAHQLHQLVAKMQATVFTPSGAIRWVVKELFGVDIFYEAEKVLGGDWEWLGALSRALTYTGHQLEDIATNLNRGLYAIQLTWGGHAADAMQAWFQRYLSQGLEPHGAFCLGAGQRVMDCARSIYDSCQLVDFLLGTIIDFLGFELVKFAGRIPEFLKELKEGTIEGILYGKWTKVQAEISNLCQIANVLDALVAAWQGFQDVPPPGTWPEDPYIHPERP